MAFWSKKKEEAKKEEIKLIDLVPDAYKTFANKIRGKNIRALIEIAPSIIEADGKGQKSKWFGNILLALDRKDASGNFVLNAAERKKQLTQIYAILNEAITLANPLFISYKKDLLDQVIKTTKSESQLHDLKRLLPTHHWRIINGFIDNQQITGTLILVGKAIDCLDANMEYIKREIA